MFQTKLKIKITNWQILLTKSHNLYFKKKFKNKNKQIIKVRENKYKGILIILEKIISLHQLVKILWYL